MDDKEWLREEVEGTGGALRPYDIGAILGDGGFQDVLRRFSDRFLAEAESRVGDLIDMHLAFAVSGGEEAVRSRGEYAIELLSLGILRREYGSMAMRTDVTTTTRLSELWRIRSEDPGRKREADRERADIFLDLLAAGEPREEGGDDRRLVDWLAATGEFVQEAQRLRPWFSTSSAFGVDEFRQSTGELSDWFAPAAKEALGGWTGGVEAFRTMVLSARTSREDLFLVTRGETLYHLNMVGAEVMNRGFLPGYRTRPDKVVLVPGCMRSRGDDACRARRVGLDISCSRCHPDCEVAALDRLAEERNFRVFVVPHASTFTAWLRHWRRDDGTALVAIACPLHLVTGGYEMRALGLEAQCVMLQYSGCKRHWDPEGIPTRVDKGHLLEVVAR